MHEYIVLFCFFIFFSAPGFYLCISALALQGKSQGWHKVKALIQEISIKESGHYFKKQPSYDLSVKFTSVLSDEETLSVNAEFVKD